MRNLSAANGIPEFGLFWPEKKDDRVLNLFQLVDGVYEEILPNDQGEVHSKAIPHLVFKILPRDQWVDGVKFQVNYHGRIGSLHSELEKRREAEQALAAAEEKKKASEAEVARLTQLLKDAGIQP